MNNLKKKLKMFSHPKNSQLYRLIRLGLLSSTNARYEKSKLASKKGYKNSLDQLIIYEDFDDVYTEMKLGNRKNYLNHYDVDSDYNDEMRFYQYEDFDLKLNEKRLRVAIEHNDYCWQLVFDNLVVPQSNDLYRLVKLSSKLGLNLIIKNNPTDAKRIYLVFQAINVNQNLNVNDLTDCLYYQWNDLIDRLFYQWNENMFELCSIIETLIYKDEGNV
ncbi:hypothetical protein [Lactobacillus johnsonii]|uniref:Uncharacterized protein n=1 Tax=Lactobacillus johnsonii TaxID=33959 RepID=A0A9X4XE36_LACJH|nr:hypothetical protein [Lactobacillus johnsonii]MTE04140.1 hypothetical protein [Lactobacillus johnsonii]